MNLTLAEWNSCRLSRVTDRMTLRLIRVSFLIDAALTALAPWMLAPGFLQQRLVTTEFLSSTNQLPSGPHSLLLWIMLSSCHFLVLDYSVSCMLAPYQASPSASSCVVWIQPAPKCWQFLFIQPVVRTCLLCLLGAGSACGTDTGEEKEESGT